MTSISFELLWPGGNETAIVTRPVDPKAYVSIGRMIMHQNPSIEQVGFLVAPHNPQVDVRLEMAGGEFCGNATRCAAYYWAKQHGISVLRLEVSGYPGVVQSVVADNQVAISLANDFILSMDATADGFLVKEHGIQHLVTFQSVDRHSALQLVKKYAVNDHSVSAMGVMCLQQAAGFARIEPYVWVRATNQMIRETGCASGSIAAAAVLNHLGPQPEGYFIAQPSQSKYHVLFGKRGGAYVITLAGVVKQSTEVVSPLILVENHLVLPATGSFAVLS